VVKKKGDTNFWGNRPWNDPKLKLKGAGTILGGPEAWSFLSGGPTIFAESQENKLTRKEKDILTGASCQEQNLEKKI